jgi:hypothetical protein
LVSATVTGGGKDMKKLVFDEPVESIPIQNLEGKEFVAYQCKNSKNVAVLQKLTDYPETKVGMFGFVPLGDPSGKPRYTGTSFRGAASSAMKSRDVYAFSSMKDFLRWMNGIWKP